MCQTGNNREGRLLHDWFTSKHRLISVVSSSPSQVVSPESAVSEELPRVINNSCQWRHAHMQAGLVEHHDEKDSQQNPNDSQRPASVHQQAQRIPTVNITEATRSINQPPRRTHPQRPPCWQCVQPNPKPYRQPCGFLFILVILFPDHSFPCDASIPMVCGGGEPDTKLMETAKHTASESKTNHSGKLHGIAS